MSETRTLTGLNCPRCGGTIPIPEGQPIVACPFCDLRSLVRGERGARRYQVPCRVDPPAAAARLKQFLSGKWAVAFDAAGQAHLTEQVLAYLPLWTAWARVLAWVFGRSQVGSGKSRRWESRERQITEDMTWTAAACDVGEFGVTSVVLTSQELRPFDPDALHAAGLVFEPVTSMAEAQAAARAEFEARTRDAARIDQISQSLVRFVNERFGLVYYPLWVLRYTYRQRAFQVVVDGHTGAVLYGKAPGNTLYRAAVLVAGMAAGAFLAVDVSGLIMAGAMQASSRNNDAGLGVALAALAGGVVLMLGAYRAFRYGEVFEYRAFKPPSRRPDQSLLGQLSQLLK